MNKLYDILTIAQQCALEGDTAQAIAILQSHDTSTVLSTYEDCYYAANAVPPSADLADAIEIRWHIEDVQCVRDDLNDEQARKVLQGVREKHDCCTGVTWDTIEHVAGALFPSPNG
jgi:hypothetical protein